MTSPTPSEMEREKGVNHEAWSKSMIGFIREKGLEREFTDWCGGWACPITESSRRSPSRREVLEEAARKIREVSADWELDGQWQKVAAAEYLESCIRALAEEEK